MKRRNFIVYFLLLMTSCTASNLTAKQTESQHPKGTQEAVAPQGNKTEAEPAVIRIAINPRQFSAGQEEKLQPLANYLTKALGKPVQFQISKDYDTVVNLLVEGKVELVQFGAAAYIKAHNRDPKIEPLVAPIDQLTKRPWYKSLIVVNSNSGINSLEDLKGKRFAFVSKLSTSGYLVPLARFQEIGIDPDRDFAKVIFAQGHSGALKALLSGEADAIAIENLSYLENQKQGKIAPEKYKIIWESAPIPNVPIVASSKLSPEFKAAIRKAFLDAPAGLIDSSGSPIAGYSLIRDEDYEPIRNLAKRIQIK